jgi:DNA invertase Pin-like site-specific DNA recombinase
MKSARTKPVRCAIYTRVSTEHGLEQDFNSLDAQYDAAQAYIRSQAHAGWTLIRTRYDDGGYSEGSTERPALQRLLADVKARKVDVIVVYKVDRLTRSLADFAKLVELFDAHGVSFVSVTQQFNTTTSMGRLTLNVLLSFAQFEREVTAERIRDKVAASKRKGLWVGGMVPLGYELKDGKLSIVAEEAERVRMIFSRYLSLGSVNRLVLELRERNVRTKIRQLSNGSTHGGVPLTQGLLFYLLRNRFYIGEVLYKGEICPGPQPPLLERELFEAVQRRLTEQRSHHVTTRTRNDAPLKGILFDAAGDPMVSTHATKQGVRYRYYVSQPYLRGLATPPIGAIVRVPAPDIEAVVSKALREYLARSNNTAAAQPSSADQPSIRGNGRSHRSPQQPFGGLAAAPRCRRRRRERGSICPERRKLRAVDPLDKATGQAVQGDLASSLDRKTSRATNEGGATYGTDQIHRARTCLARRDRLRHCQHRRHCRAPEVQRSSGQHGDIDGLHRAGSGQGRRRRAASARHRRRQLAGCAGRMVVAV